MKKRIAKCLTALFVAVSMLVCPCGVYDVRADVITAQNDNIVLTLGADLTADQRAYILDYFNISEDDVVTLTITNADEREQLEGLIPDAQIGTHTYSCALIRLTSGGGVQVKTANLTYVTGDMIASTLSTSGVYNCEVLTAAPFEVSGTGALTGVMMAYAAATGEALDPEMQELASEELVLTGEVADSVGKDEATLVVNDIKIHIIRDQVKDEEEIKQVVEEVVETTEAAAEEAGVGSGVKLGEVEKTKLCEYGTKLSKMNYNYKNMQRTLERVTYNASVNSGIKDPMIDTFSTLDDDEGLLPDSILLGTDDDSLGDGAVISSTSNVALGEHPAEKIEVVEGDVTLKKAGSVKADKFIEGTDVVSFRDLNGSYGLMDLNGNLLTEAKYADNFKSYWNGVIKGTLDGDYGKNGALASDGTLLIPFEYDVVEIINSLWGYGVNLVETTDEENYDYYGGGKHWNMEELQFYFFGNDEAEPAARLDGNQFLRCQARGNYINIEFSDGSVSTFDNEFNEVDTAEYIYDFGKYDTDAAFLEQMKDATGYSYNKFEGNYARIEKGSQYGVGDKYGNVIIPVEFDRIDDYNGLLMAGGYCAGRKGDQAVFVTQDGVITASYDCDFSNINKNGMSAHYKSDNGDIIIYSGDGVESNLGNMYESFNCIQGSKGLLYKGYIDGKYDLVDWHGNVLLEKTSGLSIAANGNYLIAQDGYSSSTLYCINDASMVRLASSEGGAKEVEATAIESAEIEAYTGGVSLKSMGTVKAYGFIGTSDVLMYYDKSGYGMMDLDGKKITDAKYSSLEYQDGFISATIEKNDSYLHGVLTLEGLEVVPIKYDVVDILNENWIFAGTFEKGTEEDYDYETWTDPPKYWCLKDIIITHTPGSELNEDSEITSVKLTRDQYQGCEVDGDYINVADRESGNIITYDGNFEMVASVDRLSDFDAFSSDYVLKQQLKDKTGYSIEAISQDGYAVVYEYIDGVSYYGVIDMEGNEIIPLEYDRIKYYSGEDGSEYLAHGYFCVEKNGKVGYVTENGEVTCDIMYGDKDKDIHFTNCGVAGFCVDDKDYYIVSADGKESDVYDYVDAYSGGNGFIFEVKEEGGETRNVVDWHDKVLVKDVCDVIGSRDGKYVLIRKDYDSDYELFSIELDD